MNKILVIRLGAIGDVVHSTIIADSIKSAHPEDDVHFLTSDFLAQILKNHRSISKVWEFDNSLKNNFFYLTLLGLKLRKERYTKVFALTSSARILYLSFFAAPFGIIKRYTLSAGVAGFFATALKLYPDLVQSKDLKIEVDKNAVEKMKNLVGNNESGYFVLCPCGANNALREGRVWRFGNWIELGNLIYEKFGSKIYICGSKAEAEQHSKFVAIKNAEILSGKLSLTESVALYSKADFVVSGDSGPLHLAAAVGVKTIGLMGSTDPQFNGPYGANGFSVEPKIDCKYCGLKKCKFNLLPDESAPCINSITPGEVINIIENNRCGQ